MMELDFLQKLKLKGLIAIHLNMAQQHSQLGNLINKRSCDWHQIGYLTMLKLLCPKVQI
jgi:hypothetical protein